MRRTLCLRIALPIALLVLSVMLAIKGEVQWRRVAIAAVNPRTGHPHEPVPQDAAKARFIGYIINAPAWAAASNMPLIQQLEEMLPLQKDRLRVNMDWMAILSVQMDWWYFLFVLLMWHLIGRGIDMRMRARDPEDAFMVSSRCSRLAKIAGVLFGAFICYNAISYQQSPWFYPIWFTAPVFLWGATLSGVSLYFLFRAGSTSENHAVSNQSITK